MSYADYQYYHAVYLGNVVPEEDFPRLALRSSSLIDRLTFGRSKDNPDVEAVKMACCAVCEVMQKQESTGGRDVASESNDGVSVSYSTDGKSNDRKLYDAAALHLMDTGMMYRGVSRA